jgi:hypothetical protein
MVRPLCGQVFPQSNFIIKGMKPYKDVDKNIFFYGLVGNDKINYRRRKPAKGLTALKKIKMKSMRMKSIKKKNSPPLGG